MMSEVTIVPANEASWDDLRVVLGTRGYSSDCLCQRFKIGGRQWDSGSVPVPERARRLREQKRCGQLEADATSGLVAYLDGEPVGWCAVEPRIACERLGSTPWKGRQEDKTDDGIWAVTCFVTRVGFRHRGVSRALTRATVDFARQRGARALEGYPMIPKPGQEVTWGELSMSAAAASSPTPGSPRSIGRASAVS